MPVESALRLIFVEWIIGTVALAAVGVWVGAYFGRFLSLWKALLVLLLATFASIALIYRNGGLEFAVPGGYPRDILAYLLLFSGFIVLMSCSLGQRLRHRFGPPDPISERESKLESVGHMVVDIAIATDSPATAGLPWTVTWKAMSPEQKDAWVTSHIDAISSYLDRSGGWEHLTDEDFVAELQRIDSSAKKSADSSRQSQPMETEAP